MADDLRISEMTELTGGGLHDDLLFEVVDLTEVALEDQNKKVKMVTLEAAFGAEDRIFKGTTLVRAFGDSDPPQVTMSMDLDDLGEFRTFFNAEGDNNRLDMGLADDIFLRVGLGSGNEIRIMSGTDVWFYCDADKARLGNNAAGNSYWEVEQSPAEITSNIAGDRRFYMDIYRCIIGNPTAVRMDISYDDDFDIVFYGSDGNETLAMYQQWVDLGRQNATFLHVNQTLNAIQAYISNVVHWAVNANEVLIGKTANAAVKVSYADEEITAYIAGTEYLAMDEDEVRLGSATHNFKVDWDNSIITAAVGGNQRFYLDANRIILGDAAATRLDVDYGDDFDLKAYASSGDQIFHVTENIQEFGNITDSYIKITNSVNIECFVNSLKEVTIGTGGLALKTGATVNEIETSLTNDDTHIPTSGAVFGALHPADLIAEGNSSVEVIDAGTGQVDITVDTALVLRALVDRTQLPVGLLETDTSTPIDLTLDCGANKTLVLAQPVYRDINLGAAQLTGPASGQPDFDSFADEGGGDTGIDTYAFDIGEMVHGAFEIQHDYKEGTDVSFHVHWQGKAAPSGTDNVAWQLTYTISRDDETLDAATVIVSPDEPFDTQYDFKRSVFASISGSTGGNNGGPIQIGDQFLFTLERVAASGDAYAGDALLSTAGLHYQVDTMGSRQIGTK